MSKIVLSASVRASMLAIGFTAALFAAAPAHAQVPSYGNPVLQRPTFAAVAVGLAAPQTGAGDLACLVGSATKTIYVTRARISGVDTTLQTSTISLIKRTVASSGGTKTSPSVASYDSSLNNGGATAVMNAYTVIPTPGAGVAIRTDYVAFNALTTAAGAPTEYAFQPQEFLNQSVVLRGVAQSLCFNAPNAFTTAGPTLNVAFEWTEK